jgi:hypothetical protein
MSNTDDNAREVAAAEALLSKTLGGWRGVIDSSLPALVFLLVFTFGGKNLQQAIIGAAVVAVGLALLRAVRRQSLQQVLSGVIGVAFAAWFSSRSGKAEDFFLPGLLTNLAYATGILISIAIRFPVVGLVIGGLQGDVLGWRNNPETARFYRMLSWWWVGMFLLRLIVQLPLYFAHQVELLGTVKIVMGWPLYLAVVWVTFRAVKARQQ